MLPAGLTRVSRARKLHRNLRLNPPRNLRLNPPRNLRLNPPRNLRLNPPRNLRLNPPRNLRLNSSPPQLTLSCGRCSRAVVAA